MYLILDKSVQLSDSRNFISFTILVFFCYIFDFLFLFIITYFYLS